MSLDSEIGGARALLEEGFDYTTTLPTVITGAGSSNTVGSYTDLLTAANNTSESAGIRIYFRPDAGGSQGDLLVNVALGSAGNEEDKFANLWLASTSASNAVVSVFDFPVMIPAGVRISANLQGSGATFTAGISLQLLKGCLTNDSLSIVDTIGATTATTDGVTVATSGTANTFGSYVEIIAATTAAYKGFIVACHKIDGSMTDMSETYNVAIGSSGNEYDIYSGHQIRPDGSERVQGQVSPFVPVGIPEGTRISIKAQATSTNADKDMDFIVYGVR